MEKYDLIVVGGGLSGVAAALRAAREGIRVLILEKSNSLGGAAGINLVNPFMPYETKVNGENKRLNAGIFEEIQNELIKMRELCGEHLYEEYDNIFSEEHLKIVLNRMVTEAGIDILFHAQLCGVKKSEDGKSLTEVYVATKKGMIPFEAPLFIDATGDGNLAYLTGCSFRLGRPSDGLCQPMTLCFRMSNVDVEEFCRKNDDIDALYAQYRAEGKIKNHREDVLIFRVVQKDVLHLNSTRVIRLDPTDPFDVTRAEIEAREQVLELYLFLKKNFECCKNAELLMTAAEIGVRESRMIDGLYTVNENELKDCTVFEDRVALGNYDIDIHNPNGSDTSHYYFPDGEYYTLPYRIMVPKDGADNLLVTGRCVSVTHEAQASMRVMPIICCLGEAAGAAAAVITKDGSKPATADVKKIQDILRKAGAAID